MYQAVKRVVKGLIPTKTLFKYEPKFRAMLYPFYRGTDFHCNVCYKGLKNFVVLENGDSMCPNCGSLSRVRRLWSLLKNDYVKDHISILDFSPSRSLYRKLKAKSNIKYASTDLSGDFLSDHQYDITNIDCEKESFDLIICYHVLEHVIEDEKAMSELFRVLKKGGHCIIQTPFHNGDIYEDFSITSEEERLKHFGQEDHVRIYSVAGLKARLEIAGFKVDHLHFDDEVLSENGFHQKEDILICKKN